MDIVLVLLGAGLALVGGMLAQRHEQVLLRRREEEDVLLEANDALLALHALLSRVGYCNVLDEKSEEEPVAPNLELLDICDRLLKLAVRLKRGDHRDIAVRLTKLALDAPLRTRENVYAVTRQVQTTLNPKMIERYENEVSNRPEDF